MFRTAKEAIDRAGVFAYQHRRLKKRQFRTLWQVRIGAALRQPQGAALPEAGLSYSRFIHQLKQKGIALNRKMLSELALSEPKNFQQLVQHVQG